MKRVIWITFLGAVLGVGSSSPAYALPAYLDQFNTQYGTAGTVLDTCRLCHSSASPGTTDLNPYGTAFRNSGHNFVTIEPLDSDGDGFSNIVEINARSFPGDPSSTPTTPSDTTPPTVTGFTIPSTSTSLTVPITTFTATDNVAATGYLVTETASTPSSTAAGWSPIVPGSYTAASQGSKTLYAWAKDAAGNISASRSASVTITLPSFPKGSKTGTRARVGTDTCVGCHNTWRDNDPPADDVALGRAHMDYLPLNLSSSRGPFYTISDGYSTSTHFTPEFNRTIRDEVTCEGCHGSGVAHFGLGPIPTPIPQTETCGKCHKDPFFDINAFLLTAHANPDKKPGKFFDQKKNGTGHAKTSFPDLEETVFLFKADQQTFVTRNERIEECSVCHSYALWYPQFEKKIAQGNMPGKPQVGCGACHDAHIPGPSGNQLPKVSTTVAVSGLSGTTVTAVTPAEGREVTYRDLKPYKIGDNGAMNTLNGIWTRGSAFTRPNLTIVKGVGELSEGEGSPNRLRFEAGGFSGNVQPHDALFLSGQASKTAQLPDDAQNAGAEVTVQATLDRAGFAVESVVDNFTLSFDPAAVATATVTYVKSAGGTGTLTVLIPLSGSVNFEVRDMRTNTETLCGSCHTRGKLRSTAWGKQKDGSFIDLSSTHNENVFTQYRTSGHANTSEPPFEEFSASVYGSSHQTTYPFDMSITGSGVVGSKRNKGNTTFQLTQTPNPNTAYLAVQGNTTQPVLINNYQCFQCHNGLGTIEYLKDRQGTPDASVLWGDATPVCITCHDPHKDQNGAGDNIRVPVKLSYNTRFVDATKNPRGGINKFMDGTEIPENVENGIICLFCHQGRESGLTVFLGIKSANPSLDPYSQPNQVIRPSGFNFINPHYFDGGAILWARNAWEYFFGGNPQSYTTGIQSHQNLNCMGCHMSEASPDNSTGGHTWRPSVETCQACHGSSISSFTSIPAIGDYDGDGVVKTAFEEIGTVSPDGSSGTGLFGQLVATLQAKGIRYNPDLYPYFFSTATGGSFTAFTTNTLTASFNLAWAFKAGNAVYVHNVWYIAQILQDSLKALDVDTSNYFRPPTNRPATDYRTIVINP